MTLIIGIKCKDAIVVGADGAATLGNTVGLQTALQPVTKLEIIGSEIVFGLSGPIGLGQLHLDRIEKAAPQLRNLDGPAACRRIRSELLQDVKVSLEVAALAGQVMGANSRLDVIHQTLVALATKGKLSLIQLDYQCTPEMASDHIPFVAIGSGQAIADPFLAFLRHIFWRDQLPSLSEASFAVMWTLTHTIRIAPAGIANPIQMAVLTMEGSKPTARILSNEEMRDHQGMIGEVEEYLTKFRQLQKVPAGVPQPPNPTSVLADSADRSPGS